MEEKKHYNLIFCVVTYRNTQDIGDLIKSIEKEIKCSYKIIIVNNFYDDATNEVFKNIAFVNDCVFIESENNGYGAGNNKAIEFAVENYTFDYLIVSNPDIIIQKLDFDLLKSKDGIIASEIIARDGKAQNPMYVKNNKASQRLIYRGFKKRKKSLIYFGIFINKIQRNFYRFFFKLSKKTFLKTYCAHGSFVIFSNSAIRTLGKPYDENMFLFAEEDVLACKAQKAEILTWFTNKIKVLHKEDGSMKFRSDINEQLAKSNIYMYEKYIKSCDDKKHMAETIE